DGIGKNMTVLECCQDMIVDDAGIMFPGEEHPGIDLILPDYSHVLQNANHLRAIIITHGHEDHIGALPYLYKDLGREVPIYTSNLSIGLIKSKFKEHKIKNAKFVQIDDGKTFKAGCFNIKAFRVCHSIPAALGFFIETPVGNIMHTGDWKIDNTPIDGECTDLSEISDAAVHKGVDLLLSDSTNAEVQNAIRSEALVGPVIKDIITQASGMVVVATFASHIHRMQQICDAAIACGRKVVITGRSMISNMDIARKLGYLNIKDEDLIDSYELENLAPNRVVVLCTGSQGEPLSALTRIAGGSHKTIELNYGDTVIVSANPVPGNEKLVKRVKNMLAKMGIEVYDKTNALVHVSGHSDADALKLLLRLVEPKAFMPVHGEASHLRTHAKLAVDCGVDHKNVFILDNGESLILDSKGIRAGRSVESGEVFVDGLSVGDTSQDVLDDRSILRAEGVACVSVAIHFQNKSVCSKPEISLRGIAGGDEDNLINEIEERILNSARRLLLKSKSMGDFRKSIISSMQSILWNCIKARPMVIVSICEVGKNVEKASLK
ncbi:MAG: ribonuclease J, partial [Eggerthellaceae bacterium]|nr:ribonuclease J [Eggerthellaceae bacterium]